MSKAHPRYWISEQRDGTIRFKKTKKGTHGKTIINDWEGSVILGHKRKGSFNVWGFDKKEKAYAHAKRLRGWGKKELKKVM